MPFSAEVWVAGQSSFPIKTAVWSSMILGQNVHGDKMSIESKCLILDIVTLWTFCLDGRFDPDGHFESIDTLSRWTFWPCWTIRHDGNFVPMDVLTC